MKKDPATEKYKKVHEKIAKDIYGQNEDGGDGDGDGDGKGVSVAVTRHRKGDGFRRCARAVDTLSMPMACACTQREPEAREGKKGGVRRHSRHAWPPHLLQPHSLAPFPAPNSPFFPDPCSQRLNSTPLAPNLGISR
jgi:hypothetical protein